MNKNLKQYLTIKLKRVFKSLFKPDFKYNNHELLFIRYLIHNNENTSVVCLTDIIYLNEMYWALTTRPGLLIGKGGEHIDKMSEELGAPIRIIEDNFTINSIKQNLANRFYYEGY